MSTKRITGMAVMSALSIILVSIPFLRLQFFPAAPFLEYDAADIPIMLATFIYGPVSGIIVTIIVSVIQGLAFSAGGIIGILMHIVSTGTFVLTGGVLFKYIKNSKLHKVASLVISIIVGIIGWVIAAISFNLLLTPIFMGIPIEGIINLLLPAILPFNLLKATINGTVAGILYLTLSKIILKHLDNPAPTSLDIIKYDNELSDKLESCETVDHEVKIDKNKVDIDKK